VTSEEELPRKLTAILYADVAGYSRLTGEDEEGTHRRLSEYLDLISIAIETHRGRVVHYAGDAVLADFATVTEALSCAWESQQSLAHRNDELAEEQRVEFRIGVNLGEVIVDRNDIYGDGVNVAARLESLAEPGGICVSESVRSAAGSKLALGFEFMGEREVKNIAEAVRAYRVVGLDDAGDSVSVACPYPGMVPFRAVDARYFYGREDEVARMVKLLRRQRFMMVIGPSGSGKSSLVYAGLLPELERSRYFDQGYWLIQTMRPGPFPTEALAAVLGINGDREEFGPGSVDALLEAHAPAERLLLLVDQFEEVFTQAEREQQARFIAALQALRVADNCAIILTLRADFYPDLMTSFLWPVDASQRVEVAPLRGEALREVIQLPAADVGVRIEDNLVDQLLVDAADEPGVLPLLQETMGLLWDDMERRTLRMSAYQQLSAGQGSSGELSGLAVAIAMKADTTLAELSPSQQIIARRIFLRLIQFGEGRADTRRQQPVASLRATNDADGEFEQTLEHLTANRLLTRSGGDESNPSAVDISHESLIDGWSRLQDWADERREAEQIRRRLEGKAAEWVRLGKGNGGLLDEAALPEAERWLASADAQDLGFDATLPELVEASQQALVAAEQSREDTRAQELRQAEALADEQRQRIDEQGRAAGRMRRSMMVLAAVLLVAITAALFAWTQTQKAQSLAAQEASAREDAETRRLEAENAQLASVAQLLSIQAPQQQAARLDERGALMARQAYRFSAGGSRSLRAHVDKVLRTVLGKPYFSPILYSDNTSRFAFSPDGSKLASTHLDPDEVLLWDLTRPGTQPVVLSGHPTGGGWVFSLVFSPNGKALVAANAKGSIGQWDPDNPQAPFVELATQKGGVWSTIFSPDGRWLATGSKLDDTFAVWDLTRADAGPVLVNNPQPAAAGSGPPIHRDGGVPVAFSPDSTMLATGSLSGVIRLWRPGELTTPVGSLHGHQGGLLALAFYDKGKHLASSGQDATIRLWNLGEPSATPVVLESGPSPANSLDFDAGGQILVASSISDIRLWQVDEPEIPAVVMASGNFFQVAFSPDGKRLASGGSGADYLRLWDLEPSGQPLVLTGHQGTVCSLAFSPDGKRLASGGGTGDETIRLWLWDETGTSPQVLGRQNGDVCSLSFSADDKRLLSASGNGNSIQLWELGQSAPTRTSLPMPGDLEPWTALFSPDGKTLAATGVDGVYAWDLADLNAGARLLLPVEGYATEIAFSPNGNTLAVGNYGPTMYLKDLTRPEETASELLGHLRPNVAWSVAFSPDGKQLASGGITDASVRLWDLNSPDASSIVLGRHDTDVTRVRFSPNGKQLASSSLDYSVRLWNVEDPDAPPIVLSGHEGKVWSLAYSLDGKRLVTGSSDRTIRVWDLTHPLNAATTQAIADKVCQKVWRNLTLDEWHKFVGVELPYERTCPNLPIHPSLFEAAEKLAKENDIEGAVILLERAVELDPELTIDPEQEALRLAKTSTQ